MENIMPPGWFWLTIVKLMVNTVADARGYYCSDEPRQVWSLSPLTPPSLNPGQQLHLSSLTYRNLTQLETFNRYLSNLQNNFSQ